MKLVGIVGLLVSVSASPSALEALMREAGVRHVVYGVASHHIAVRPRPRGRGRPAAPPPGGGSTRWGGALGPGPRGVRLRWKAGARASEASSPLPRAAARAGVRITISAARCTAAL